MPALWSIAGKDLRLLARDRVGLFWVVGFPIAFAAFFGSVMKAGVEDKSAPLRVIAVDESADADARRLGRALRDAGLHVQGASLAVAQASVRRGDAVAFVRVRMRGAPRPARVELGIDPSRRSETALLRSLVAGAAQPLPAHTAQARVQIDTVSVLRAGTAPKNGFEIVFPAMLLWGLLGCAATFAIGMVAERASGTLLRLRAAPIARASLLGGKAAACVAACVMDSVLLTLLGLLLLGVRIADPIKYAAATLATAICFAGLTMALSMLGKTEQAVAGAGWATLILMAMLGGAMVPLTIMPPWLLSLSDLSPVKWGIAALEGATWRAFGWRELAPSLVRLACFGLVGFACGTALLWSSREV